ncbi:TPR repeat protein [Pseudomonas sp. BIGb0278]|uniref:hypothetical protein n=1 Tax=Pseudomonas sp. BIGb0278 TaxID=2940607 RepID=UPI002168D358|nr:hypothetical protein [Pseudomonas sp. BIGb0278]MCS4284400.1 TPR repeat protein [Pseudomonas sp. BIGb0278]
MTKRSNLFVLLASVTAIAFVVLLGEWKLNKKSIWDEIAENSPLDAQRAAVFMAKESRLLTDAELSNLARTIVSSREIKFSQAITNELIYKTQNSEAKKLAVYIAEQGFIAKGDILLSNRAALEYKIGRFVPRNLEKATIIFSSPTLKNVPISKFYLAEILLDNDNPKKDPKTAKELLTESANSGIEAAKQKLKELQ